MTATPAPGTPGSPGSSVGITTDPPDDPALIAHARSLASHTGLPLRLDILDTDILLVVTPTGLEARVLRGDDEVLTHAKPFRLDLTTLDTTTGPGRSLRNPLFRAVGLRKGDPRRPAILDTTAGFGEDAWLLAGIGCTVACLERHPAIFALLHDALHRAADAHPDIAGRITLHHTDALTFFTQFDMRHSTFDIAYLDPMFPAQRKTAQRKPMRLARALVGEGGDAAALLQAALRHPFKRIVVKRPRHAPHLADLPPVSSHEGKALRYDVYVP